MMCGLTPKRAVDSRVRLAPGVLKPSASVADLAGRMVGRRAIKPQKTRICWRFRREMADRSGFKLEVEIASLAHA